MLIMPAYCSMLPLQYIPALCSIGKALNHHDHCIHLTLNTTQDSGSSRGLEAYGGIVTPSDEFQFWAATVTEKVVGGRAILKAVNAAFEPLRSSFAALDTLQHSELEEVCIRIYCYYYCAN
jgi:hypothetical protein